MVRKTEAEDEIRSIVGMVGYSRGRGSSPLVPFYSMYIVTHLAVPPLVFPSIFVMRQYRLMAKCRGKSDVPICTQPSVFAPGVTPGQPLNMAEAGFSVHTVGPIVAPPSRSCCVKFSVLRSLG